MIYTIDNIPAKLFFRILSTGDISLLSTEPIEKEKLKEKWLTIQEQDELNRESKEKDKILKLAKKVTGLAVRHEAMRNAISILRIQRDNELEQMLREYNCKIEDNTFNEDLNLIERTLESVRFRIARFQSSLTRHLSLKQGEENTHFEDLFISYLTFLGFGFKDANSITLLEFRGIEKQVFNKIKSLENND